MLARLFAIRPGEGGIVLRLGGHLFLVLASTTLILTAGEGLFIAAYPSAWLPYAYLGGAVLGTLASLLYEKLQRRMGLVARSTVVALFLAALLVALWGSVTLRPAVGPFLLFLAVPSYNAILMVDNSALIARSLDPRSAKRLFASISICGNLGVIGAGMGVWALAPRIGAATMLWPAVGLLVLLLLPVRGGERAVRRAPRTPPAPWRAVLGHRFALLLLLLVLFAGLMSTIVRYQMGSSLKETLPPARISSFLGLLSAGLNVVGILFQLFVARWLLSRLGVGSALAVHPAAMAGAAAVGAAVPGLAAATGTLVADRLLRHQLLRPIVTVALMPLPDAVRSRASVVIQGTLEPLAIGLGCIGILATARVVPWHSLSIVLGALGVAGLVWALLARRGYAGELAAALHARRLRIPEGTEEFLPLEAGTRRVLREQLQSEMPERVMLALQVLEGRFDGELVEEVRSGWPRWDPAVRVQAIRALAAEPIPEAVAFLRSLPREQPDPALLRCDCVEFSDAELNRIAESGSPEARAEAMLRLFRKGGLDPILARLWSWIRSDDAGLQGAAARVIGASGEDTLLAELPRLAQAAPAEAIRAMAERPQSRFAETCLLGLSDDRSFAAAREALLAIGPAARPVLEASVREPDRSAPSIRILGEIGDPESRRILLGLLEDPADEIRYRAAKSLLRCGYETAEERETVRSAARRELDRCRRLKARQKLSDPILRDDAAVDFEWSVERVFVLLSLLQPGRPFRKIHLSYFSGDARQRSFAIEALEEALEAEWRTEVVSLLEGEPDASAEEDPWERRVRAAREKPGSDAVMDRAVLLKSTALFRSWRLRDLEAPAVASLEREVPAPRLVWRGTEGVELERSIAGEPVSAAGDFAVPLGVVYRSIVRRPQCGVLWLRALAARLTAGAPGVASEMSVSGASIASARLGEDHEEHRDLALWQRVFFLRSVPLFADLSSERLRLVAEIARGVSAAKDEALVREGKPGHHFYVVCSGYAEVSLEGRRLGILSEGSAFGELSLLTGEPRSATVRALAPCDLLTIDPVDFLDLLHAHPTLVKPFAQMIARRILAAQGARPERA